MPKDELFGWAPVETLSGQCAFCKYVLTEGTAVKCHAMASCEYGQVYFPGARQCLQYEPTDMDE